MTLKNYSRLALLNHAETDRQAVSHCRALADTHGLGFIELASDHGLLKRLAGGDWESEDLVKADPGQKIPFF